MPMRQRAINLEEQRGGVQGASRYAAFPPVQGWNAAHDQVARTRSGASAGSRTRERHLQEVAVTASNDSGLEVADSHSRE